MYEHEYGGFITIDLILLFFNNYISIPPQNQSMLSAWEWNCKRQMKKHTQKWHSFIFYKESGLWKVLKEGKKREWEEKQKENIDNWQAEKRARQSQTNTTNNNNNMMMIFPLLKREKRENNNKRDQQTKNAYKNNNR